MINNDNLTHPEEASKDKRKYKGPRGAAKPGTTYPGLAADLEVRKRQLAEAEERGFERHVAHALFAELCREHVRAKQSGDFDLAEKTELEIQEVLREIKDRFGY